MIIQGSQAESLEPNTLTDCDPAATILTATRACQPKRIRAWLSGAAPKADAGGGVVYRACHHAGEIGGEQHGPLAVSSVCGDTFNMVASAKDPSTWSLVMFIPAAMVSAISWIVWLPGLAEGAQADHSHPGPGQLDAMPRVRVSMPPKAAPIATAPGVGMGCR